MRLSALLLAVLPLLAVAKPPAAPAGEGQRLARYVTTMLDGYWKLNPESALAAGYYKYADRISVYDAAARQAQRAFDEQNLRTLAGFDLQRLSVAQRLDVTLMRNQFESDRWYLDTFKAWQWQPSQYNVADTFALQLGTEYAPVATRLRHVLRRLAQVPAFYAAAKANIAGPTLEDTLLAIEQNQGALGVFDDNLMRRAAGAGLSADEKARFSAGVIAARAAITDYINFLTDLRARLEAGGARSFRIGRDLYTQKFTYDIRSGYSADELYAKALAEKASLHQRMEARARELWPKYLGPAPMPDDRLALIGAVIDELGKHHVAPAAFVDAIRAQLPELTRFVREHDLVDQDASRPLVVREMPVYLRGSAGANIQAPGPYAPKANTYYNVTPLDGYTPERAESFLREYNDWMLQLLNIHEAIPGHYTQLMHANKAGSLVKTLFGNGAMIEGWAVYGERMMLEAGYSGGTPEMWLIWMKWNLRAVCNTILDHDIQTGGMTREQMMDLLVREAFQSEAEASAKWRRATLTQVQLTSYYDGYAEIVALREEQQARLGAKFDLKAFHNRFLSYGSVPVRHIRELMAAPAQAPR